MHALVLQLIGSASFVVGVRLAWTRRVHLCVAAYCTFVSLLSCAHRCYGFCFIYYCSTAIDYFLAAAETFLRVAIFLVPVKVISSKELVNKFTAWD